jgi:hypothetical protein
MASASALRQLASAKLAYFEIMRLDPLVNNGSSETVAPSGSFHASNQALPDANGASALEQDRCVIHCGEFPGHAMRHWPNVAAASAGLPVRSWLGASLLVDKLFRD